MQISQHHVQFFTAVCNNWLKLLEADEAKNIVVEALRYRVSKGQVKVCAFVIMPNHIHLIWRIQNGYKLEEVQRDFLKFTAKKILSLLERKKEKLFVGLKDRKYQVWKRNSMSIDLIHKWFFRQKFNYLHENPCQTHWRLASRAESYKFSSARFYETGQDEFGFLCHDSEI